MAKGQDKGKDGKNKKAGGGGKKKSREQRKQERKNFNAGMSRGAVAASAPP